MKHIPLILMFFLLTNCVTRTNYNGLEDRNKKPLGNEDLQKKFYYSDDGTIVNSSMPTLYSEFIKAKVNLSNSKGSFDYKMNYINAGIALSNRTCSLWFDGQYSLDKKVNTNQNLFSLIRTLAVTAMTFEGNSAKAIGSVSLGFDGINQGYEFFKENFLLTNTLLKLRKNVVIARKETAEILKNKVDPNYNYYDAQNDLREYHFTCHPMALRGYIDESVELTRYVPADSGESIIDKAKKSRLNLDLYSLLLKKTGMFSDEDLKNLYLQIFGADTEESKNMLEDRLNQVQITIHKNLENSEYLTETDKSVLYTKLIELGELMGFKEYLNTIIEKDKTKDKTALLQKEIDDHDLNCDGNNLTSKKKCIKFKNLKEAEKILENKLKSDVYNEDKSKSLILKVIQKNNY